MGGLACLFGLAVAAPYCWQHPVLNVHELIERQSVRPVETQPLPVRTTCNFDTLRSMHTVLQQMVDAEKAPPATIISSPPRPRVMVTSASDRLAMLDTRTMRQAAELIEHARPYVQQFVAQRPAITQSPAIDIAPTPLLRQSPGLLIDRLEKLRGIPWPPNGLAQCWAG